MAEFFSILNARIAAEEVAFGTVERIQANPTCRRCLEEYQKKYPNQAFKIKCEGIWEDPELEELAKEAEITFEEAKETKNTAFWAQRHIKLVNDDGVKTPFEARNYQEEILRCTSYYKVNRTGRGLGKTTLGIIEDLHEATTRRNLEILIVTPAKAQAAKWFNDLKDHIIADEELQESLAGTPKQAPYYEFRFRNGSSIRIFCTGASSGRHGDTLRTQTPRRTRMDEQDYLAEEDYKALQPFFHRYKNSQVAGSSTPTGARGMFWKMCRKLVEYKEFHFPITVHPDFSKEMEESCRLECRTELVYQHEYLAEFGEMEAGVFKPELVDACLQDYLYVQASPSSDDVWRYFMGVDWNGRGTGTRIRVVGFHPETKIRRVVDHSAVDKTTMATLEEIRRMNKRWHCEEIMTDAGFGFVQDELLRLIGHNSTDEDDQRLKNIQVIDFGADLKTNKLVPRRDKLLYINDEENELSRRTKPFMVEGMTMIVEQGRFQFSRADAILEEQMRAYRVKNYSQHGWANTYTAGKSNEVGDHDLDATILACLGIELKYGLFFEYRPQHNLASGMFMLPGLGVPETASEATENPVEQVRQVRMDAAQIPSRQTKDQQTEARTTWFGQRSFMVAPASKPSRGNWGVPGSRTAAFRNMSTKRT